MIKYYCDNCGTEMSSDGDVYMKLRNSGASFKDWELFLCRKCQDRLAKHLRRVVHRYKKGSSK